MWVEYLLGVALGVQLAAMVVSRRVMMVCLHGACAGVILVSLLRLVALH